MTNKTLLLLILFSCTLGTLAGQQDELEFLTTIAEHPLYVYADRVVLFTASMAIDADGSPRAYHPSDIGIDKLANAGRPGNWWALATDSGKKDGNPYIQGKDGPAPGYYVSVTSLFDPLKKRSDPARYVNAEKIPYIVIPRSLYAIPLALPGDMAVVYDIKTGSYCRAIVADVGSDKNIGEGSVYLANMLGIPSNPKTGGCEQKRFVYLIFTGSGNRRPLNCKEIEKKAGRLFHEIDGEKLIEYYLAHRRKVLRF